MSINGIEEQSKSEAQAIITFTAGYFFDNFLFGERKKDGCGGVVE